MMRKPIFLYSVFQFFFPLYLWLPLFFEFQQKNGISEANIFQIQSLYYVVFFLLEIPGGIFADRLGYRKTLFLGMVSSVVSHIFAIFYPTYLGFLSHFVLLAFARSLISGTANAYLYELLKENNSLELYEEVEGHARSYGLLGKVVGWAGVGVLFSYRITLPYEISLIFMMIAGGVCLLLPSLSQRKPLNVRSYSFDSFIREGEFWGLAIQGVALFTLARIVTVNLFQPFLIFQKWPTAVHGIVLSGATLLEAFGSHQASRWMENRDKVLSVGILSIFASVGTILLFYLPKTASLVLFGFLCFIFGVVFPIQKKLVQDSISHPESRATFLSVESMLDRLGAGLCTGLLSSFIGDSKMVTGIEVVSVGLGGLVLLSTFGMIYQKRRKSHCV